MNLQELKALLEPYFEPDTEAQWKNICRQGIVPGWFQEGEGI